MISQRSLLAALLCIAWILPGLIGHDPWKPDEAHTFGVVYEILRGGSWVVPALAGEPFLDKPPLFYLTAFLKLPRINDVTTDLASPPRFVALAKRTDGANPSAYPGQSSAEVQAKAYPDLRTVVMDRSAEETFELVEEAVRRLRWRVVAAEPPTGKGAKTGTLEATDQTLLVGFTDDIAIRVEGSGPRTRVDVRSASRYGKFDFGQNATRVRKFFAELQARVDATAPGVMSRRALTSARARALLKRQKAAEQTKAGSRNVRGPAQSNSQRGLAQKERQR